MKGTIWPRPFEKDPSTGARRPVKGSTWTYQFAVMENGRRRHVTKGGFRTKREAEQALAAAITARSTDGPRVEPSKLTLTAYVRDEWLPALRGLKPSTRRGYSDLAEAYVLPHLGETRLRDLTAGDIARLYDRLRVSGRRRGPGGLSESSLHHVHVCLSKMLGDAVEAGLLDRSPVTRLPRLARPKATKPEMTCWTGDELRRFLDSARDDRLHALYGLTAATGLRRGEVVALRWGDVDLEAGQLAVRRSRVAVGYAVEEGTPKSSRARTVALDPGTVAMLRTHRRRQLEDRLAWGAGSFDGDLVFTREDGSPLHPQTVAWHFGKQVRRAGVPHARFHDLRHTHATLGLAAGVPPKVMQERLGHSSIQITLDLYSHVVPGMQEDAAAKIGAMVWGVGQ